MFCRKCGNQIPDDSEFCPKCGTAVGKEISGQINSHPAETVTESPNTVSVTYSESANSDTISKIQAALDETKPKKSNKPLIITLTVAVIAIVLAAIIIPITVSKNKEAHHEFKYHISEDDTYIIDGYTGTDLNVIIPDTINKKPVVAIADKAFCESDIESIIFGENVTKIGVDSFKSCENLKSVQFLTKLVVTLEAGAFEWCSSLSDVQLPQNYVSIGGLAFYRCYSLKSINAVNALSVGEAAFSMSGLESIELEMQLMNQNNIALGTFALCENLKNIELHSSVISEEMFVGCISLERVDWVIPKMTASIGDRAFYGCVMLEKVNLNGHSAEYPNKLNELAKEFGESKASSITIGENAFADCFEFKDPEPTTKHNQWAGTCYFGKTLREAIKYANDWEMSTYLGNCVKFYDPLGDVITNECYDYNDKIYLVILHDENRYLSSDLGKTDFVYVGITLNEVFSLVGQTQINNNVVMDSYTVSYNLYGYNFELYLSGSSSNSIVTSVWIRSE